MKITACCTVIVLTLICLVFFANAAEKTSIRFTSAYTDMTADCRDKFSDVGEGQDMPLICKGRGNYMLHVDFSACCDHVRVEGKRDFQLQLPPQTFSSTLDRKLEWRLANGKPFAIIFRIDRYKEDITMPPVTKAGSVIIIKGLRGFTNIDHEVDAKRYSNPNLVARRLADQDYLRGNNRVKP